MSSDLPQVLERPLYSIGEAARLLQIQPSKLRRWLEGAPVPEELYAGAVTYPPVIRPVPTGSTEVSWAEFVEAAFLGEYRVRGVTLQRLRPFIQEMRVKYGVPYPLAHFKPYVDLPRRELLVELQSLQQEVSRALVSRRFTAPHKPPQAPGRSCAPKPAASVGCAG